MILVLFAVLVIAVLITIVQCRLERRRVDLKWAEHYARTSKLAPVVTLSSRDRAHERSRQLPAAVGTAPSSEPERRRA